MTTEATPPAKMLVLYFSQSGNTETMAKMIAAETGSDIIRLRTERSYPEDYNTLVTLAQEEKQRHERPALATKIENIDAYDVIFLGYPNWRADLPMPIYTFLDTYDLFGKTIAPFCTHGGSGLSGTVRTIMQEEPKAKVVEGLAVRGTSASSAGNDVDTWLKKLGFTGR